MPKPSLNDTTYVMQPGRFFNYSIILHLHSPFTHSLIHSFTHFFASCLLPTVLHLPSLPVFAIQVLVCVFVVGDFHRGGIVMQFLF